jgi:WD40 repeat protein
MFKSSLMTTTAVLTTTVILGSTGLLLFDLNLADPTADEREQIKSLLTRLDDDSCDVREAASNDFVKLGLIAEPALRQAVKDAASAEVRVGARLLRYEILSKPKTVLRGHTEEVHCVAFAPAGKLLASGSSAGTGRLWYVAGGKALNVLIPK